MASLQEQLALLSSTSSRSNPLDLSHLSDEELAMALAAARAARPPALSPMERALLLSSSRSNGAGSAGMPPSPLLPAAADPSALLASLSLTSPALPSHTSSGSSSQNMALELAAARRSLALASLTKQQKAPEATPVVSAAAPGAAAPPKKKADFSKEIQSMEEQMKAMQELFSRHTEKKKTSTSVVKPSPLSSVRSPATSSSSSHGFKTGQLYGHPKSSSSPEEDDVTVTETTLGDEDEEITATAIMPPPPNRLPHHHSKKTLAGVVGGSPRSPRSSLVGGGGGFKALLSKRKNSKQHHHHRHSIQGGGTSTSAAAAAAASSSPTTTMSSMLPKFTKKAYVARMDDEIASMKEELRELELAGPSSLLMLSQQPPTNKKTTPGGEASSRDHRAPRPRSKSPFGGFGDQRKKPRNRSPDR